MLVSLWFGVQTLTDVITHINALYVMTIKSITEITDSFFSGYNTTETTYRFSAFCLQLWY